MSKKLRHKFQDDQAARMSALAKRKGLVGGWVPVGRHTATMREWRQYVREFMPHTLTPAQTSGGFQPGEFQGFTNTRTVNRMLGGGRRRRKRAPVRSGAAKRAAARKRTVKRRRYLGLGRRRRRVGRGRMRGGAWGDRPAPVKPVAVAPITPPSLKPASRAPAKKNGWSTAKKLALAAAAIPLAYLGYKNSDVARKALNSYNHRRTRWYQTPTHPAISIPNSSVHL